MNFSKIEARHWTDGQITAPVITTLKINGNLTADITLTAPAGTMAMKTMTVAGTMLNSTLRSSGNVKDITVGGMDGSSILVGVNDDVDALPQDRTDFVDIDDARLPSIASFTVHTGPGAVFANANVSAWSIGKVNLANVQTVGDTTFGIAASSLGSYTRHLGATTTHAYAWTSRLSIWPADDANDFVIAKIPA